ncbi:helix-turn-helix protein [Anoxybacillus vitaminiphilus]|uniref:Helix-turn-helix protein n=1 Tax=Paranoxybacillus vitaminiphilus TaxID=581036 RepID=A0A327YEF9_9BACL|nr:helix-turn-helix protein [Anoxybacillus vitaminiphilus]
MTKYSLETKLAAVKAYLEGVDSFKVTAQEYNVSVSMLKKWVTKYREHGSEAFQEMYTRRRRPHLPFRARLALSIKKYQHTLKFTVDVSIVYAKKGDPFGNLIYDKSARNTNPSVAMNEPRVLKRNYFKFMD